MSLEGCFFRNSLARCFPLENGGSGVQSGGILKDNINLKY
jgi:hypothetical protein